MLTACNVCFYKPHSMQMLQYYINLNINLGQALPSLWERKRTKCVSKNNLAL